MKKYINVLLIVIVVLTIFTPALTNPTQTVLLTDTQIQNIEGGRPVSECSQLLLLCAGVSGGSLWCLLLAGVCLIV